MKKILILACVFLLSFSTIFASSASAASVFKDLPETDPNYKDLKFLFDRDLMYSFKIDGWDNYFGVKDSKVTREYAAVMIGKVVGIKPYNTNTPFKDVSPIDYMMTTSYILELSQLGIIKGYSDGTFRPNGKLTRGHLAIFIERAFGNYLPEGNSEFSDVPKSSEAYNAVKKLVGAGITTGYSDGTFKPEETLTKLHLNVFMARLVRYLESQNIKVPLKGTSTENTKTNQQKPIDDSKIKLGMPKAEVYDLVEPYLYAGKKDGDLGLLTTSGRNGLLGKTHYLFKNGKLQSISTSFDWESLDVDFRTADELHEFYIRKFVQEFGTDYKTYDTSQTLIMTTWRQPSNTIILSTSIHEKVQVDLMIVDKIPQ